MQRQFKTNEAHLVTSEGCFDETGAAVKNADGAHLTTFEYDARGEEIERRFFGDDEQPMRGEEGCFRISSIYDEAGNRIERACRDASGDRIAFRGGAFAVQQFGFDERGCQTNELHLDPRGTALPSGVVARIATGRNSFCDMTSQQYFDNVDHPIAPPHGTASREFVLSERGRRRRDEMFRRVPCGTQLLGR